MPKTTSVAISDELQDQAISKISPFSVALILDDDLAGSGTLIRWGDHRGILTVWHVPHNPEDAERRFDFGSTQRLHLTVQERASCFGLPVASLRCVDIGVPDKPHLGPDISVLVLPRTGIGTLTAKKDFFSISHRRGEKLQAALQNDGFFVLLGNPGIETRLQKQIAGFAEVLDTPAINIFGHPKRRYEYAGFDFVEIPVGPREEDGALPNFKGISGGGLWKFPLRVIKDNNHEQVQLGEPILAGVSFWQTPRRNGKRRLRCHAGRSLYNRVLDKLRRLD